MKAEDFAAWLLAISGMSEGQRREAVAALEKASVVGGALSKPGATNSNPQAGSKARSAMAHTNRYRYKSLKYDTSGAFLRYELKKRRGHQTIASTPALPIRHRIGGAY